MIELSAIAQTRYHKITASATPFGTPDGSTTAFQLVDARGRPITRNAVVAGMHRTDWQGRQSLLTTPRTNIVLFSQDLTTANGWSVNTSTCAVDSTQASPDGLSNYYKVTATTVGGNHGFIIKTVNLSGFNTYTHSVIVRKGTSNGITLQPNGTIDGTASGCVVSFNLLTNGITSSNYGKFTFISASVVTLPNGDFRVSATFSMAGTTAPATMILWTYGWLMTGPGADTTTGVYNWQWGHQFEMSAVPTGYLRTTSAAVTVTDYSNTTSGAVTLGQAPIVGATLDWDGTGVSVG